MKLIAHYPGVEEAPRRGHAVWRENYLSDGLYYSHRDTEYTREDYPSMLHYHDYYELLIYVEGDIHYISETQVYQPRKADVILVPPGKLHMSMLNGEKTRYERHVFYLYPDALESLGADSLLSFLSLNKDDALCVGSVSDRVELLMLLQALDDAHSTENPIEAALAPAHLLRIFYAINGARWGMREEAPLLPQSVLEIRAYIDENFTEIESVSDVASHFYYSREYVSRLFKQYFNTTVVDYLRARRVAHSCKLIAEGATLGDACFQSGFSSLSAFIRSFRAVTGMTPSSYRSLQ